MTRLIIWRHGQTEWNAEDRIQGHTDIDLDDVGRAQAVAAAAVLAAEQPDAIVASDLRRAADTAGALAAATGLPVRLDPRLREQSFGKWQGLTNVEARAAYPDEWLRWRRGEEITGLGIEDRAALMERALAAMTDAAQLGETVVVATHGGTAKYAMGALLGWPDSVSVRVMGLLNCHWAEIEWHRNRGGWVLRSYNLGVVPGLQARSDGAAAVGAGSADDAAVGAGSAGGVATTGEAPESAAGIEVSAGVAGGRGVE